MSQVAEVTPENCYNDSAIGLNMIFTTISLTSGGLISSSSPSVYGIAALAAVVSAALLSL